MKGWTLLVLMVGVALMGFMLIGVTALAQAQQMPQQSAIQAARQTQPAARQTRQAAVQTQQGATQTQQAALLPAREIAPPNAGWSFIPDYTFTGSQLKDWRSLGKAQWRAKDGEIIVTPSNEASFLILNRSLQDVGFHAWFQNEPGTEAGFLFRMETTKETSKETSEDISRETSKETTKETSKEASNDISKETSKQTTKDTTKAVLVSIKDGEANTYRILLDQQGRELSREKLRAAGSIVRLAPPASAQTANNNNRPNRPRPAGPELPLQRPETALRNDAWNQAEIFIDANIIRSFLNDGREMGAAAEEDAGRYGPVALYAAGSGTVRFKEIGVKDIAFKTLPAEASSPRFKVQRINDMYYSWGAGAADFDRDGITDIVAGPYIYFGPDYTRMREIFPALAYNPSKEFTEINCQYTYDFNGDGWPDIFTGPPRATIYLNPKGESRRWDKFEVIPSVQTEITVFRDIDGDGKPELIYGADGSMRYAKPDPADPTKPWVPHIISGNGYMMGHGIGVGDINGDGRTDIINPNGWWEQPVKERLVIKDGSQPAENKQPVKDQVGPGNDDSPIASGTGQPWTYHPVAFARYGHRSTGAGGAVIAVYDLNGDGRNDVVSSLNAHGFGLAWFEQRPDGSFTPHIVMDDYSAKNAGGAAAKADDVIFSQLHGTAFADVDGDGILDFIAGKRYWSHLDNYFDPDPYGAPVLYWFRTVRDASAPGGARLVPELVHNRSGAGSDVLATDLDKDGKIDIVTSTDRGTFIFWNKGK